MSFDLFQPETNERLAGMAPVRAPEAGVFDGFARGSAMLTMRGLVKGASGLDLALGGAATIGKDFVMGIGTETQDRFFKKHDETFGPEIDRFTPEPNEVGVAAEVVGGLLSTLPLVLVHPGLAVAATMTGTAEELVKKGVSPERSISVGAVQGAALGVGVWMPILGQNLWQRVLIGGAGANLLQGVGARTASGMILEGTKAAEEFKAFDGASLTLDALLGAAFGGIVHLSPRAREQGAQAWERIQAWAEALPPTEKAAIAVLRQAQHMNVDSVPGTAAAPADVEAHVARVRTALEQLERGERVQVSDLPEPKVEPDPARAAEAAKNAEYLVTHGDRVRKAEDIPAITETEAPAAKPAGTEPPPPRGSGPGEAAGAEADPWAVRQAPMQPRTIEDAGLRSTLQQMADNEAGWAEVGGRMIRKPTYEGDPNPPVVGRTQWLPKADWWKGRAGGLNEQQTQVAVKKALAGEALNARERRAVDYMTEVANQRLSAMHDLGPEEWSGVLDDLKADGIEPTHQNAVDADLVSRASRIDDAALEKAALKYENDDAAFMAEVRRILDQATHQDNATSQGRTADRGEAKREGSAAGEATAEEVDPVRREAERLVAEEPDRLIRIGTEADGSPAVTTAQQYLDDARATAKQAAEDAKLFEVAAACMLGKGG